MSEAILGIALGTAWVVFWWQMYEWEHRRFVRRCDAIMADFRAEMSRVAGQGDNQ